MSAVDTRLAVDGGQPIVTAPEPHFTWPPVGEATERAVVAQLHQTISIYNRSGIIEQVEDRLAEAVGVRRALLTSTGTAALHTAYTALDLGPGDQVVCPAYTFFATVSPLLTTGAEPVFVDCGEDGNIDPAGIEAAITTRTKAVVVTHMWGVPCDMERIVGLCRRHRLALLEDTSHAHGAHIAGRPVGSFGDLAAQSLQGQKPLTGGEGGVLFTDRDELYYRSVAFGHYNKRCKDEIPQDHWLSDFATTGYGLKLRIHPLAAAIVDQQLDAYPGYLKGRQRTAVQMIERLERLPGLRAITPSPGAESSWYALILRLSDDAPRGLDAERAEQLLHAEGAVEVDRPGSTRPLPRMAMFQRTGDLMRAYRSFSPQAPDEFPNANAFSAQILKLPVWHRDEDLTLVDSYLAAFEKVWSAHAGA